MTKAFEKLVDNTQSSLHKMFLAKAARNQNRRTLANAANLPWSWVAESIIEILNFYPMGISETVLLSTLELKWERSFLQRIKGNDNNFYTIQAVYDANAPKLFPVEVKVLQYRHIASADTYQITVTDELTFRYLDIYVHPKFNQWINSDEGLSAFKGRTLRVICGAKILPLVDNNYDNASLPRHAKVALLPPTPYLIFVLNKKDRDFVKKKFYDRILDNQSSINKNNKNGLYRLWLKVMYVENFSHDSPNGSLNSGEEGSKNKRTDIYLNDMSSDSDPILLSLFDEQTQMALMIRRNDYLGLYNPKVSTRVTESQINQASFIFEFTNDTVIFLMPDKEAQDANLAKLDLASIIVNNSSIEKSTPDPKKEIIKRDEEGIMDCISHPERIYINQLQHNMINVDLLGRVIAVANNNPLVKENQKLNRYAMKVADSTGVVDITLWEDAGRDSRALLPGQYVLLSRLSTSGKYKTDKGTTYYVNGSVACGTKVHNISTLSSLLTSSCFRIMSTIRDVKKKKRDHCQVEAIITGWELHIKSSDPRFVLSDEYTQSQIQGVDFADSNIDFSAYSLGDRITTLAHKNCKRPVNSHDKTNCKFCGSLIGDDKIQIFRTKSDASDPSSNGFEWQGWIEWRLDDGSDWCRATGGEELLLGITPRKFLEMSHEAQVSLLDSAVGNQIICSLSSIDQLTFRIDQIMQLDPSPQECIDMLDKMDIK